MRQLRVGTIPAIFMLVLLGLSPIVIGPMLVVWKDIGMSAFLTAGTASLLAGYNRRSKTWLLVSAALLTVGTSYRTNAMPALLPLLALLAWSWARTAIASDVEPASCRRVAGYFLIFSAICTMAITLSLSFRLPDFKPLPRTFNAAWTQTHDLLGTSVCTGRILLPTSVLPAGTTIEDLRRTYRPEHVQLSFGASGLGMTPLRAAGLADVEPIWLRTILEYPTCYLWHRLQVAKYLMGLNAGPVFYITHAQVDENEFDIKLAKTPLTDRVLSYVVTGSEQGRQPRNLLARVWVFALLGTASLLGAVFLCSNLGPLVGAIFASGALYFGVNAFVLPAADARYQHWFVITSFLMIVFLASAIRARLRPDPHKDAAFCER